MEIREMRDIEAGYLAEPRGHEFSRMAPTTDVVEYLKAYAREKPEVAALWCFGIGFVLGWKLKPW